MGSEGSRSFGGREEGGRDGVRVGDIQNITRQYTRALSQRFPSRVSTPPSRCISLTNTAMSTLLLRASRARLPLPPLRHIHRHNVRYTSTTPSSDLISTLRSRGLIESTTGAPTALSTHVQKSPIAVYSGVDATATSLHIGHLLPLMNLLHFYLAGHHSISIIGKATASVGDPSGRKTERDETPDERLERQFQAIWKQVEGFYIKGAEYAESRGWGRREERGKYELVTNSTWLEPLTFLDFLRDVGRHVRVAQMMARDSVKSRLNVNPNTNTEGLNYAEFTYQLLQSYDFLHLYRTKSCTLQIGGNDQFGNITAGIDLITRLSRATNPTEPPPETFGLTVPLLLSPSGEKIGKTAGNAVWLDEKLTTSFELYQHFLKLPDAVLESYLKRFTLLSLDHISSALSSHAQEPEKRSAQHLLANEIVSLIHGPTAAARAALQTKVMFSRDGGEEVTAGEVLGAFGKEVGRLNYSEVVGVPVVKVMRSMGLCKTKDEAKRLVGAGGVYLGAKGERVVKGAGEGQREIKEEDLMEGRVLMVRVGKGRWGVVEVVKD